MNYKVLAISTVIGAGVIGFSLWQTQTGPSPKSVVERLTSMDIAAPETQFGFSEAAAPAYAPAPPAEPPAARATADQMEVPALPSGDIPVGQPQIAYLYSYGYRVPGPNIPALQQRHADMCESKGPQICRIIAMDQTDGGDGDYARGTLQLAVASGEARAFGKQLATIAEGADGEQIASAISGEDLSKRIVDTEARLRARTVLRDRLMEVLATRRGTVAELVEAERGVAQVNEEIDQARSWLSEMKGRVAFSRLDITYESALPSSSASSPSGGFMAPVRGAVAALGPMFGVLAAVLILLGSLALPGFALWLGARALWRRTGGLWLRRAEPAGA